MPKPAAGQVRLGSGPPPPTPTHQPNAAYYSSTTCAPRLTAAVPRLAVDPTLRGACFSRPAGLWTGVGSTSTTCTCGSRSTARIVFPLCKTGSFTRALGHVALSLPHSNRNTRDSYPFRLVVMGPVCTRHQTAYLVTHHHVSFVRLPGVGEPEGSHALVACACWRPHIWWQPTVQQPSPASCG